MLKVKNLSKSFGDKIVVDDLSFSVANGKMFALLGANGAGKTTTFRMILGVLNQNDGSVTINDKPFSFEDNNRIGYLPEERSLLLKYTIAEQINYFGELKGIHRKVIDQRLDQYLKKFDLEEYKHKQIKELSKGNQQKIQFITAIIHNPEILILDEPFSGLDPINIQLFKDVILKLQSEGKIIIFSSHRFDHVEDFCEDIIFLINGKDVINGKVSEIKKQADSYIIQIKGENIDIDQLKTIPGVIDVRETVDELKVKINDYDVANEVFTAIKNASRIEKFLITLPSLEEVIIQKVGETNEG